MLRLVGWFILTLIVLQFLRLIPGVGTIFRIPFLGFWGAAVLVSLGISWLGNGLVRRRRLRSRLADLGATDTPHNQGKLGALLLSEGAARRALEPLRTAVEGDPDRPEWPYRLGCAYLAAGRPEDAVPALERAAELDEEYAYGQVLARLADALTRTGRGDDAVEVLARFERNHGPTPEWAYRRGLALRAAGRKDEARESFGRATELAGAERGFKRNEARGWALKAFFARLG